MTTMALTARVAATADVPGLCAMMAEFNLLEGIEWTRETGESGVRRLIADRDLGVIGLLSESDHITGYFVVTWGYDLEWNGRDAYLTELYLIPQARGRGLGRVALEHAERFARRHDVRALHLMVRQDNLAAVRLYKRAGYAIPPRVFMSKPL
ncbi:GNAT family N-acetyltransferase [Nocardia pseudobrasiliensis]|uniref:GNAT family acetyltransferase n=1 Tax=Nocardia pseudobrasiliensis TaxID=45979 RepID=A0A370I964_9NOCA|nr:GNAT family N-acetyltransferase [Nocardia pseudobrasiliensis]RDI66641.1 GNAT family acetyltransferase [Nocardia pseudobrasiliensis]